jgi:hypothetical protein
VTADVEIAVTPEPSKVYLKLSGAARDAKGTPLPTPEEWDGTPCWGGATYTPSVFFEKPRKPKPTDEQLAAWTQKVFDRASVGLPVLLAAIAIEYLAGVAHLEEATGHPDDWNEDEVIENITKQLDHYLRRLLKVPQRGKRSRWTGAELERAVRQALTVVPVSKRTLDGVAAILRERDPKRAPVSGEALGVLLTRLKLSWRKIKADS